MYQSASAAAAESVVPARLAEAADDAALSGATVWFDLTEAFYVKYAEKCDAPLASD